MNEQEFKSATEDLNQDIESSLFKTFKMKTADDLNRRWASSEEGHIFISCLNKQAKFLGRLKKEGITSD